MQIIIIVVSLIGAFLIYLLIEYKGYPTFKVKEVDGKTRKALLLTWEKTKQSNFWSLHEKEGISNLLKSMQDSNKVELVIPLEHKLLKHPEKAGKWTNCTIVLFDSENQAEKLGKEIISYIQKSQLQEYLKAADIMQLQNGLDLFYPMIKGKNKESNLKQTAEYVFSNLEHRQQYYKEQYLWSEPAMADLHSRDKVGRFIGFEVKKRIFGTSEMPEWDLFHVYGFTRWQIVKSIPFFFPTWNKHAKRAFGEDMTFKKKIAEWDRIRLNVKSSASQNMTYTLQERYSDNEVFNHH